MSNIIIDLEKLDDYKEGTGHTNKFCTIRIFAQYQGIAPDTTNSVSPKLRFTTVPYFNNKESWNKYYQLHIDEGCYHSQLIEQSPPQEGDVLDLRCGVQYGNIEILHFKRITVKELNRLRDFLITDTGRKFAAFTGIRTEF
ncbi:HEL074Cp [Eremothecium sinecaudum]|uniref:HEL074Cp n=1 Tax=Eremothecium sinecaudum TaxID=45286 RepID=A0A0X8HST9_9SACH|nr:HEL074Cp [Eremothecium sinecaudum]AMD21206.1 HEL074Cp [Eremothecium sinecaudum]